MHLISYSLVGLFRLCWHFFENNRYELAFENNASIFGGICQNLWRGEENLMIKYYSNVVSHKHTHTHTNRLTRHHLSAIIRSKVSKLSLLQVTLKDFVFFL